ncbi:MAG: hypothetical protein Q8L45_04515 [Xanthomonadaceae bacterium]|nr:hypothetical protein [Xanthomonadaceae bacterium]MDP2186023.1 hypothetical protein [Xanthomonadales bacterium]MDZ4377551.1 hypothetical protein [Xanthomonadaceae bacterium]
MANSEKSGELSAAKPFGTSQSRVITQKRFSTRTRFELEESDFSYRLDTEGSSRTYRLEYAELSSDRETLVERNPWWRNVGLLWMLIGVASAAVTYSSKNTLSVPIWLWLGMICYAVYHFKVIRYQIIPAERCNVVIIDDATGAEVIRELESRRVEQLRQRFDYLAVDEHPEQQRRRIEWLGKQGALDVNEVSARLLQLNALAGASALAAERREQDDE